MKKFLIFFLAGFAVTGNIRAQQQRVELDLKTAIEIALDKNPTIRIAGLEVKRQKYVRNETIGGFLPAITAEGTYTRAIEQATMGGLPFGSDNTLQGSGTVTMPLIVPALWQTLRLNERQMRAAVEAARGSRITLVNEVKKAYYSILMGEESLSVLYSSQEMVRKTVDDTQTRFENEMASEYDLVTAQVQLSNLQPTIFQAQNSLETARKMLRMLLELPDDFDFVIADKLGTLATAARYSDLLNSDDISMNSDLRAMDIQGQILKRQLGVMRTQRMPTLAAFGNVTFTGQDQISNLGDVMAGLPGKTSFKWQHPINVGATLSVPLFAGFSNVSRERQLKNSIKQLDLQRDYLESNVKVQASNAIANIGTAFSQMQAVSNTIVQAQKGYDISKVRFDAGMGTILELNSAELALTQARLNYAQAVYDYLSAQADYEKIIGRE